jgi:hypothetical protein
VVIALASRSHIGTNRAYAKDKPASGPLARRGSNPFPGAMFILTLGCEILGSTESLIISSVIDCYEIKGILHGTGRERQSE